MSRGPDAGTLMMRALEASAAMAGCPVTITSSNQRRWASATFLGAQHRVTLAGSPSPELEAWVAALPESEFALRGHLVAELGVLRISRDGDAVSADLEILTVEER